MRAALALAALVTAGTARAEPAPARFSEVDCVSAMYPAARGNHLPSGEVVSKAEVLTVSPDLVVCRVERTQRRRDSVEVDINHHVDLVVEDTTIELAPVTRAPRLVVGERVEVAHSQASALAPGETRSLGSAPSTDTTVALSRLALTGTESALFVDVTAETAGPGLYQAQTESTLYRITRARLVAILTYASTESRVDAERSSSRCQLVPPAPGPSLPSMLSVRCEQREDGKATTRVERYRWDGTQYEPAS
jgi:hypothetical protein